MKVIYAFLVLLFGYSESMNISCRDSNYPDNITKMCNVSAEAGENLEMLCNVSESLISCVRTNVEQTNVLENIFNIGSIIGWIWLGGRGVYKWLHNSPREDYMRSSFQRLLSSELLSFIITAPSIISIFTDAEWGNYLINAGPLIVGGVQLLYDIFKIASSSRKNKRLKLFAKFIERLESDLSNNIRTDLLNIELYKWAMKKFNELKSIYCDENLKDSFEKSRITLNAFKSFLLVNC